MVGYSGPAWYQALTLTERVAAHPGLRVCSEAGCSPDEKARQRLAYWKSQAPFDKGSLFARRLAVDGITEEQLLGLLAKSAADLRPRLTREPDWLSDLRNWAFSAEAEIEGMQATGKSSTAPFLAAFQPWLEAGRKQLRQGMNEVANHYERVPFPSSVVAPFLLQELPSRLQSTIGRTLVLELNVARLRKMLIGRTPAERFSCFLEQLRQPEMIESILQEYPVLARRVVEIIRYWLTSSLEFWRHLCGDWDSIRDVIFMGQAPGTLVEMEGGMGDLHRNGRAVRRLKFASGASLVYKPRSLDVDIHFQELLRWLNARDTGLDFRTLRVLSKGDHGWTEYVQAETCTGREQIIRFYQRQGAFLALLYTLNAADFHHENLIAAGEYPVLVDLESLFHPVFDDSTCGESELMAGRAMDESVLRTGFLPLRFWAEDGSSGVDLSGLGGAPGQSLPQRVPGWEEPGTDEMRFVRQQRCLAARQNRPTLHGEAVNVTEHQDALETGFVRLYRLLKDCATELLSSSGPLASFANDRLRVILRPTQTYAALLTEGSHPDVLRDALDRDCLFDRLWTEVEQFPYLEKIIRSEIAQLHQGDIPLFNALPRSRDLWLGTGERITDFFGATAIDLVRSRIRDLNEDDLKKQLWFINASLATLRLERPEKATYRVAEPSDALSSHDLREALISKARAIGDHIHSLTLRGKSDVAWVGLGYGFLSGWSLQPASLDLYNGLPGIALYLAYLGEVTRDCKYTTLAREAIGTALNQLPEKASRWKWAGFCDGAGGMIYALAHLGTLWKEPVLLEEARKLLDLLPALIARDEDFDIVYGSAGCIGALRALHSCSPSAMVTARIRQCAEHLVSAARPMTVGLGWPCAFAATQPLTGFSHGAAGISWALMEAAAITGDETFRRTALAGAAYERSVFCPAHNNWPDFRIGADGEAQSSSGFLASSVTWCNGAPGIGLSRLGMFSHDPDPGLREDMEKALSITVERGLGLNHSLCHGDLGNVELLIQANDFFKKSELQEQLNRAELIIHQSILEHGYLTGVPKGVETPGLMSGLAGIGYGLLRLAAAHQVPPVVSLGVPVTASAVL